MSTVAPVREVTNSQGFERLARLGLVVGTSARGLVFGLVGLLLIRAAVDFDPQKARGLDGALRSLAQTDAGPWLLYAAAAGLLVFGIYGMAEAGWART